LLYVFELLTHSFGEFFWSYHTLLLSDPIPSSLSLLVCFHNLLCIKPQLLMFVLLSSPFLLP